MNKLCLQTNFAQLNNALNLVKNQFDTKTIDQIHMNQIYL